MNRLLSRRAFFKVAGGAGLLPVVPSLFASDRRQPAASPDEWNLVRKRFAMPSSLSYLNHGTLGPPVDKTREEMQRLMETFAGQPMSAFFDMLGQAELSRKQVAEFFEAPFDHTFLTVNTTAALSMIIQGFPFESGDHVLMTNQEHSPEMIWATTAKRFGVAIDEIKLPLNPTSDSDIVTLFEKAMTDRTRLVQFSHVSFITGMKLPAREIALMLRKKFPKCWIVVDGAQATGHTFVSFKETQCHAYATSGHKGLLAPLETGVLMLDPDFQKVLEHSVLANGASAYTDATGTRNFTHLASLKESVTFLQNIGMEKIEARWKGLRRELIRRLGQVKTLKVVSPDHFESPLVAVQITNPKIPAATVVDRLRYDHNVIVKVLPPTIFPNCFRVSLHVYTEETDLNRLENGLKAILLGA